MATITNAASLTTPMKTPIAEKSASSMTKRAHHELTGPSTTRPTTEFKDRFEAYNRLQAAAVAFGEKLPIPEIVAIGGQSDGKSSLLEALLGFRFNVREVEMGTRRPLILQMIHDPTALEPRCRFQEEESEEYGVTICSASAIADTIRSRTEALLKKAKTAVSSKPIVMRAEYTHCPNITIIDTPGFVLKAKKGEPENTPDEILSMVKSLASPPHRIILFLQQSSVEWCSSLWLDSIREIDPTFRRTVIVVSKFDNRLKLKSAVVKKKPADFYDTYLSLSEMVAKFLIDMRNQLRLVHQLKPKKLLPEIGAQLLHGLFPINLLAKNDRWEVDRYLSASGYLGENTRPFFVAMPKDRGTISNDEFRRQISQVDAEILRYLRDGVKGGFDEEKFRPYIGFSCLRDYLESELQKRYKEAAPATLALLEQRCSEITAELARTDSKLQATSDVAHLRRSAMLHAASICNHVGALIEGAADPAPEQWGKTTEEERSESGIGNWPGVVADIKPPNASLRLYGGAAFERVMHEFRCATYSIECPQVSREKVANILLAHAGQGGRRGVVDAAAEIARASARSWLAPLLDMACNRLAYVLGELFDLAIERNHHHDTKYGGEAADMDGYVAFHAALRHSYNCFIKDLGKQCKKMVRHHLDSVTSPYSQVCYENDFFGNFGSAVNAYCRFNGASGSSYSLELSDGAPSSKNECGKEQENIPPGKDVQETTPGKAAEAREALRECQMTVPETPSPDLPCNANYEVKKELGNCNELGARKRHPRVMGNSRYSDNLKNGSYILGNEDIVARSTSAYSEICSSAAQHFARIREVLVERSVASILNSGFLTPCRERLMVELGVDLFAVNDEKFMDMFVAPGAIDILQNERQSLQKRQKILHCCLNEFKSVAKAL